MRKIFCSTILLVAVPFVAGQAGKPAEGAPAKGRCCFCGFAEVTGWNV